MILPLERAFLRKLLPVALWVGTSAFAIEIGDTRAELLFENGQPNSAMVVGNREIIQYPHGRVTLEDGAVTKFEPAVGTSAPNLGSGEIGAARATGWLTTLREAREQAATRTKPILFLVTGNLERTPWGKSFGQAVQFSPVFASRLAPDYVLLRLDVAASPASEEAVPPDELKAREQAMKEFLALRDEVFGSDSIPALAVLDASTTRATVVDLSGAAQATDLLGYTQKAIRAAHDQPRKEIAAYKPGMSADGKRMTAYVVVGILAFIWLANRLRN